MLIAPPMSMDKMITQGQQDWFLQSFPSQQEQSSWNGSLRPPILSALKNLRESCFLPYAFLNKTNGLRNHPSHKPQCLTFRHHNQKAKQNTKLIILQSKALTLERTPGSVQGSEDLKGACRELTVPDGPCAGRLILWDKDCNPQFMSEVTEAHGVRRICLRSHGDQQ